MTLPHKLISKLEKRKETNSLRTLVLTENGVDYFSNDYLGFARSKKIYDATHSLISSENKIKNGSTGSRLIS